MTPPPACPPAKPPWASTTIRVNLGGLLVCLVALVASRDRGPSAVLALGAGLCLLNIALRLQTSGAITFAPQFGGERFEAATVVNGPVAGRSIGAVDPTPRRQGF